MTNPPKLNPKPPVPVGPWTQREIDELRFDASQFYLDGKTAQARILNHKADLLARKLRRITQAFVAKNAPVSA